MLLSEEQGEREDAGVPATYKYQPAEELLRDVIRYYKQEYTSREAELYAERKTEFYGVYSPISRCGKTGLAAMLSQVLSERGRTLYLNFEEYSGFRDLFGKSDADFSELFLHLLQGREGIFAKLQRLVRPFGRAEYIPPGLGQGDFRQLLWEHWERFFENIREEHVYDYVVMDLGDFSEMLFPIFGYCKGIYMPVLDDPVSEAKLKEFRWICFGMDEKCFERIRKVTPPCEAYWECIKNDSLNESMLYAYAAKLLEE